MAGDVYLADVTGATGAGGPARALELAEQIRAESTAIAAAEARRLRGRGPAAPRELVESAVLGEVQAVLGVSQGWAGTLIALTRRLRDVLPETLAALESGRLDLIRARVLAEATAEQSATNVLLVDQAGMLQRVVRLPKAPAGGWTRRLVDQAVRARLGVRSGS